MLHPGKAASGMRFKTGSQARKLWYTTVGHDAPLGGFSDSNIFISMAPRNEPLGCRLSVGFSNRYFPITIEGESYAHVLILPVHIPVFSILYKAVWSQSSLVLGKFYRRWFSKNCFLESLLLLLEKSTERDLVKEPTALMGAPRCFFHNSLFPIWG